MMKRLFCLMLALLMLLAVGCTPSDKPGSGNNGGGSANSEYEEHLTITLAIQEIDGYGDDEWSDYLEEKFNVTIEPVLLDQASTQLAAWAAADELPDIICDSSLTGAWLNQFVDDEMLRPIPEDMLKKYPAIYDLCVQNPCWQTSRIMWPDDIWFVSRPTSQSYAEKGARNCIVYRKDWAANVGITKAPETWDELYDMLYKFTYNDPDGNGKNDTYGMLGEYEALFMWMTGAMLDDYIELENGDLSINWIENTEEYIEVLEFVKKCYHEGLWDKEFSGDRTRFTQGLCGVWLSGQADPYWYHRYFDQEFAGANELDASQVLDYIGVVPWIVQNAGDTAKVAIAEHASCTAFSYAASDEVVERALAICEWMISEEGNRFRNWGFEGVDYEVNEDGTLTKLHEQDLRDVYPSLYLQNWPTWDFDSLFENPMYRQEIRDLSREICDAHAKAAEEGSTFSVWTYVRTDLKDRFSFSKASRIKALITDKSKDVRSGMQALRDEAIKAGILDVIDSVQDLRDANS